MTHLKKIAGSITATVLALAIGASPALVSSAAAVDPNDLTPNIANYDRVQKDIPLPEFHTETIIDIERALQDAARDAERRARASANAAATDAMAESLREGAREWAKRAREMDAALAEEERLERQDAVLRRWANFFGLVAIAAQTYKAYAADPPADSTGAESAGGGGPDGANGDAAGPEGQAVRSTETHAIRTEMPVEIDGKWTTVPYEEIVRKIIYGGGGGTPPADRRSPPLVGAMFGQLDEWAANMPPLTLACNSEFGGCQAVDSELAPRFDPPDTGGAGGFDAPAPIPAPRRAPTEEEAGLFKLITSLALDLAPVVGPAKSVVEIATGEDPVTGESIPPAIAAAGFVLSVVPGGKLWVKTGGKSAIEYGSRVFRHYTSRAGSNGILEKGVLEANRGKVFAEGANRRVLAPRDAEQRYNIRTGRGRDYVEFQVPKDARWSEQPGLTPGVTEIVIEGDVPLGPGAKVMQRR